MDEDFMEERARRKIFVKPICPRNKTHLHYEKLNKKQHRDMRMFDPKVGHIYSSITIFENKVLLLNMHQDAFAILIENAEVAETLKTLHGMLWASL